MSNGEQDVLRVEDWAGDMGETWLAHLDRFEGMIAAIGDALLRHAAFTPGESVLDVGCGGGANSRAIARSVAPGGRVVGLDISAALVGEARRRAQAEGLANAEFVAADAATVRLPGPGFDRLFSRFGVMFFADPQAAFTNLAAHLRPGGRADFAVWAPPRDNAWVAGILGVLGRHLELPPPQPGVPGPFALDDPNHVSRLLANAGLADLNFTRWQGPQYVAGRGSTPEDAAEFILGTMAFAEVLRAQPEPVRAAVMADVTDLFRRHHGPDGVTLGACAWLVTARRPLVT